MSATQLTEALILKQLDRIPLREKEKLLLKARINAHFAGQRFTIKHAIIAIDPQMSGVDPASTQRADKIKFSARTSNATTITYNAKRGLKQYYNEENRDDPVLILLEDRYKLILQWRGGTVAATPAESSGPPPELPRETPANETRSTPPRFSKRAKRALAAAALALFAVFAWFAATSVHINVPETVGSVVVAAGRGGQPWGYHYLVAEPKVNGGRQYIQGLLARDVLLGWTHGAHIGDENTRNGTQFYIYVLSSGRAWEKGRDFDANTGELSPQLASIRPSHARTVTLDRTKVR